MRRPSFFESSVCLLLAACWLATPARAGGAGALEDVVLAILVDREILESAEADFEGVALGSGGAQAYDQQLVDVAATSGTTNTFLGGNGSGTIAERSASQVRASLVLATTDDVTFDDVTGTGHSLAQTYAGEIVALSDASIDFRDGAVQTLSISADTTFTTTTAALSATHARACRVKVTTDGTQRTLTFPGNWKWLGTKPATLALSTSAYLFLVSDGANETDCVARWVVLGNGS